jgi:sialate O-acetylesterase
LVTEGEELSGFELGDDNGFKPAKAKIDGEKIIVSSNDITKPTQVRYAWENNPKATLFNKDGLPASPFQLEIGK